MRHSLLKFKNFKSLQWKRFEFKYHSLFYLWLGLSALILLLNFNIFLNFDIFDVCSELNVLFESHKTFNGVYIENFASFCLCFHGDLDLIFWPQEWFNEIKWVKVKRLFYFWNQFMTNFAVVMCFRNNFCFHAIFIILAYFSWL